MHLPEPIPAIIHDETFAGVTYHIRGELVPELQIEVGEQSVMFEHHVLLWKQTQLEIELRKLPGAIKRKIAGLEFFVTRTKGTGHVAFSRDSPGQVIPIHLSRGESLHVREHQFLAASQNIDYSFERVKGVSNILMGGSGFFIDKFHSHEGDGILWLHGYGNVFERVLGPNEAIDVEPGGWLYKEPTVSMETNFQKLATGLLGSMNLVTNRFTGPGRIGIQSMYMHLGATE